VGLQPAILVYIITTKKDRTQIFYDDQDKL
jgi:hypothetical protein